MKHYMITNGALEETTENEILLLEQGNLIWSNEYTSLVEPYPNAYWNRMRIPESTMITIWGPFDPRELAAAAGFPTRIRCGCFGKCPGPRTSIATEDFIEASREFAESTYQETEWGGYGD